MSNDLDIVRPDREAVIGTGIMWLSRWTLRLILIAIGLLFIGWLIQQIWSILLPILLALILTTVLQPPSRWLERRLHFPKAAAAATVIAGALAVMTLAMLFVVPSIAAQATDLANNASDGLTKVEDWGTRGRMHISHEQVDSLVGAAQDKLRSSASTIASGILVGVNALTSALITALLTFVLSFLFLKDGHRFLPWLRNLTGYGVGIHVAEVGARAWDTLGSFVRTQALVGLIDAVLIGTGLFIVGIPLALPLAILTFAAAFAPIIGAVAVGALAALVALVANGWISALIILAIVILVQQLEGNVLLPWLQGKSLNLHAGVVLLTVVLSSTLFGVVGAFLGVPLVAVAAVVLRYVEEVIATHTNGPQPTSQTSIA